MGSNSYKILNIKRLTVIQLVISNSFITEGVIFVSIVNCQIRRVSVVDGSTKGAITRSVANTAPVIVGTPTNKTNNTFKKLVLWYPYSQF